MFNDVAQDLRYPSIKWEFKLISMFALGAHCQEKRAQWWAIRAPFRAKASYV